MPRKTLIEERKANGLSQEEIAKKAFMSRNSYALIEAGKRSPSLLSAKLIGSALGVAIDPTGLFNLEEDDAQ